MIWCKRINAAIPIIVISNIDSSYGAPGTSCASEQSRLNDNFPVAQDTATRSKSGPCKVKSSVHTFPVWVSNKYWFTVSPFWTKTYRAFAGYVIAGVVVLSAQLTEFANRAIARMKYFISYSLSTNIGWSGMKTLSSLSVIFLSMRSNFLEICSWLFNILSVHKSIAFPIRYRHPQMAMMYSITVIPSFWLSLTYFAIGQKVHSY